MHAQHRPPIAHRGRPRRLLAGTVAALLMGLVVAACGSSSSSGGSTHVLKVGVVDDNPPFSYLSPQGKLQGFDVTIAKGIAKSMGDTVKLVRVDGPGRVTGLQTHQLDLTVADLTVDPVRAKAVAFTTPYLVSHNILITLKGKTPLNGLADVNKAGIKLASPKGATTTQQFESEFPKAHTLEFTGIADMLGALSSGQVQGAAWDDIGVIALTKAHPEYVRVPGDLTSPAEDIAAAVPNGSTATLKAANAYLHNFVKSGQEAKAFQQWFQAPLPAANVPPQSGS
jgi:polar amino acid transport system substrate-binding protein